MRLIFFLLASALAALPGTVNAAAQSTPPAAASYPNKPIRVIVPFAAGGGLDLTARLIGQKLTEKWGQPLVIDARPGAGTVVGTEIASKAVADGYTLLMITTTFAINPALRRNLPYDPLRDFVPVTQINAQPNVVVVSPSSPTKVVFGQGSNDANLPVSLGIPAIRICSGGHSGGTHSFNEWYQPQLSGVGPQASFLTTLALVGIEGVRVPILPKRPPRN